MDLEPSSRTEVGYRQIAPLHRVDAGGRAGGYEIARLQAAAAHLQMPRQKCDRRQRPARHARGAAGSSGCAIDRHAHGKIAGRAFAPAFDRLANEDAIVVAAIRRDGEWPEVVDDRQRAARKLQPDVQTGNEVRDLVGRRQPSEVGHVLPYDSDEFGFDGGKSAIDRRPFDHAAGLADIAQPRIEDRPAQALITEGLAERRGRHRDLPADDTLAAHADLRLLNAVGVDLGVGWNARKRLQREARLTRRYKGCGNGPDVGTGRVLRISSLANHTGMVVWQLATGKRDLPFAARRLHRADMNFQITPDTGSTARQIERQLKASIIAMELPPGMRLSETEIALKFGVSRQPVREAMIALARAELVTILPQRGTVVVKISADRMMQARFIREQIEAGVARRASETPLPESDRAALDDLIRRQADALARNDIDGFKEADERFHRRLSQVAGLELAWQAIGDIKAHLDRVCHLTLKDAASMRPLIGQHQAILDAVLAGDADAAEAAMRHHLTEILRALPAVMAERAELFG